MRQRNNPMTVLVFFILLGVLLSGLTGCVGTFRQTRETEETTYGIDVARYQGTIEWDEVARYGVDFAMIRVGYRSIREGEIQPDSNGRYNLQEGAKAGVSLGAYFFSTAISEEEAIEEAKWVVEQIQSYPITYPVVYDCEEFRNPESRQYGMTKEERTDVALAFLKTIEKSGYEGMFYASKNEMEMESQWEVSRIASRYKIWVAQYPVPSYPETASSSYSGEHAMWQYSREGSIPGIDQPVDLNVAYFGYDGVEPPKDDTELEEVGPDVEAMMDFEPVEEMVTAKNETNLRDRPDQEEDCQILYTLKNGETVQRVAVSSNGWSKLIFNGDVCYAVSSYLTTDLNYVPSESIQEEDDGIQTQFSPVNKQVTAKNMVNLRKLPSVEREDAVVLAQLRHGDVATCVGVSENGWSKLVYQGMECYAVSSYLEDIQAVAADLDAQIQTEFETVSESVTAKEEVNLRTLPSTEHPDVQVVARIKNGDIITRTGINRDLGWSRVVYNGQTLYCISSYLMLAE